MNENPDIKVTTPVLCKAESREENSDFSAFNQDLEDEVFEIGENSGNNKKIDYLKEPTFESENGTSGEGSPSNRNSVDYSDSNYDEASNTRKNSVQDLRQSLALTNQMKSLVNRFNLRTESIKTQLRHNYEDGDDDEFLTNESETASNNAGNPTQSKLAKHLNELLGNKEKVDTTMTVVKNKRELGKDYIVHKLKGLTRPIKEQSLAYLLWLAILSSFYLYNLISIPLRYAFNYNFGTSGDNSTGSSNVNTTNNYIYWLIVDYLADLIYLIDIVAVKIRIKFIQDGLWITEYKPMALHYLKSLNFLYDLVSLLPFDLIQIRIGWNPLLRINRIVKIKSLWEFFDRWDKYVQSIVFVVRFIKLFIYLLIINHFYACAYYAFSQWEVNSNLVFNSWVDTTQNGTINEYIYSFLFALKLASTIGNNPPPETKEEYLFTAITYIISIFIFALIVDQIRGIVRSLTKKQDDYLIRLARTNTYLNNLGVTEDIKNKIKSWFDYNSNENETGSIFVSVLEFTRYALIFFEVDLDTLSFMPINIQTDIAINVHFDMLSKVHLFQNCDKNLLYSLVLRIKPVLFMPGDWICKKGNVGREMYIVDKGIVEVFVNGKAVVQLKKGSVFGEISLLAVGGGNRRTADVISKGFSTLYVLHKQDLNEVLVDYPDVEKLLKRKAKKLLNKGNDSSKLKVEPILNNKKNHPRIIETILNISRAAKMANNLMNLNVVEHNNDFYQLNDGEIDKELEKSNDKDEMKENGSKTSIINELNHLKSLKRILFHKNKVQSFETISERMNNRPFSVKLREIHE